MKSFGKIFLLLGIVFLILSFTGDQSPALGIVFIALGTTYYFLNDDGKGKRRKEKGNS